MKIQKFFLSAIAIAALCVFTGCSDDEDGGSSSSSVKASPTSLSFDVDGGTDAVTVTCDGEWLSSTSADWVTVSPSTGKGDATVNVTVSANYINGEPDVARSTIIQFSNPSGTSSVSVTVSQSGDTKATSITLSVSILDFDSVASTNSVVVNSDGEWTASTNDDWITMSPESGIGATTVNVTVTDNPDAPRTGEVVFSGGSGVSASLTVSQDGDDYSGATEYTVAEICNLSDGSMLSLPNAYVVAVSDENDGYLVSDDFNTFIFVSDTDLPSVGDGVAVLGRKSTNTYGLPVILSKEGTVGSSGNSLSYPDATAINGGNVDTYTSTSWSYVCVTGKLSGSTVSAAASANNKVNIIATPDGMSSFDGTKVLLYGFYAGTANKSFRVLGTSVEDGGETLLFSDDLQWVAPYAEAAGAGDTVGTGLSTTSLPHYSEAPGFEDEFKSYGYDFTYWNTNNEKGADYVACFLQTNYLRFGYTNGAYHAGIIFPALGYEGDVELEFAWCPMRGGGLYYDRVYVDVLLNDDLVERFSHALTNPDGAANDGNWPLEWIPTTVTIPGVGASDNIVIRSYPWDVQDSSTYPSISGSPDFDYLRYFLEYFEINEAY